MSEFYGESSRDDAIATLRHAVELGVTLFDTADMYGQGDNERMVGEALGSAASWSPSRPSSGWFATPRVPSPESTAAPSTRKRRARRACAAWGWT